MTVMRCTDTHLEHLHTLVDRVYGPSHARMPRWPL